MVLFKFIQLLMSLELLAEILTDIVLTLLNGEIPVFLGCPDVDPMHSQKLDKVSAVSSLCLNKLAS